MPAERIETILIALPAAASHSDRRRLSHPDCRAILKDWYRAIFEVCVHRNGISSADLQRILGFGSYGTAWHWTHKIRRAMVR